MKKNRVQFILKIALFLVLLGCIYTGGSLLILLDGNGYATEKEKKEDTPYYASEMFEGHMNDWFDECVNYLRDELHAKTSESESDQEEEPTVDQEDVVATFLDYDKLKLVESEESKDAVEEMQRDSSKAVEKTVESADSTEVDKVDGEDLKDVKIDESKSKESSTVVTMDDLENQNSTVFLNILNGNDVGEEQYIFYNRFKNYILDKSGHPETEFLKISGSDYYAIMEKYASHDGVATLPDRYHKYGTIDFNLDDERYYVGSNDQEVEYDMYSMLFDCPNSKCYYNPSSGNVVAYDEYNNYFYIMTSYADFDLSFRDADRGLDFYIPLNYLDFSSKEAFDQSVITTPFVTVEDVVYYEAAQERIESAENDEENLAYTHWFLNDYPYEITLLEEEENVYSGGAGYGSAQAGGITVTYDGTTHQLDEHTKQLLKEGQLQLNLETVKLLDQFTNVKSVSFTLPTSYALNEQTYTQYAYFASKHKEEFVLYASILLVLLFVFLVLIIRMEPAELRPMDRHYLLTKCVVVGVGFAMLLLAIYCFAVLLNMGNVSMDESSALFGVCLVGCLMVGIGYSLCLGLLLSVERTIRTKNFIKYLWLATAWKWVVVKPVRFLVTTVTDFWEHGALALKSLVFVGGFALYNCLMAALIIALGLYEGSAVFFFFFLICLGIVDVFVLIKVFSHMKGIETVVEGAKEITGGNLSYKVDLEQMSGANKELAIAINDIGRGLDAAVEQSTRDERLKAELITNVSHDIKTPLTSIINYVDLIKREGVTEEPIKGYVGVLEQKSARLKQLIEDLVEASKASTGNIELECTNLNMTELVNQTIGEFEDKFKEKELELISDISDDSCVVYADGRRCFRVIENLFQNVYKYAMPHTRVYLDLNVDSNAVTFVLKNISEAPLTKDLSELTQRFVRGEESRTTEGSGLGLSIAKSLTELQGGTFGVSMDGDLFKVMLTFPSKTPVDAGGFETE